MRPLMAALVEAGDDVAVATGASLLEIAEAEGVTGFSAGLDSTDPISVRNRTIVAALPREEIRRFAFAEVFVRAETPPRLRDLEQVCHAFKPDLVVHEIAEFAGPIIATARGIPYVTHSFGPLLQPDVAVLAGAAAAPYWKAAGLQPHPLAGLYEHLYLDICPPSLQVPAISQVAAVQTVGPPPVTSAPTELPWLEELTTRPIVYVTLGTVYNSNPEIFKTILGRLGDEDLNVVVTVGRDNDPSMLGPQPPNVVVHSFVPQHLLLPHCATVITHGGAGSVLGALSYGIPLLVVPQGADQYYNAERVTAAAAGVTLLPSELTSAAVRSVVRTLLDDPALRSGAQQIKAEFDAMPGPAAVRRRLLEMVSPG